MRDSASACPKGSHSPSAGIKKKAPPHECVAPKEPVAIGREDDRSGCSLSAHDRAFASLTEAAARIPENRALRMLFGGVTLGGTTAINSVLLACWAGRS